MDILDERGYTLTGLEQVNVVLGKNGCGKSRMMKAVERALHGSADFPGRVKYLSPERGGSLKYDPNQDRNMQSSSDWLAQNRRQNQAAAFREQSVVQFRKLELLTLREIEANARRGEDQDEFFDDTVASINSLLDHVEIRRAESDFTLHDRRSGEELRPEHLSSGEAELISLGIECYVFGREAVEGQENLLFMDEPDLHLHPDLQTRLARFIQDLVSEFPFQVLIATHSTAFLGALRDDAATRLAFMLRGDATLSFSGISEVHRRILPVFGAHPLSNVFNEAPVLLIEGEDDERIWQQAVRSARGRIRIYPCHVDGLPNLPEFEREVARILDAVYDEPIGYSLRDGDDQAGEPLEDLGPVRRMRLNCRSAENLILTNEVMARVGLTWEQVVERVEEWIDANDGHPHHAWMSAFRAEDFDRRSFDLKQVRNDLMGIMGSEKPWEVVVGQAIADLNHKQAGEDGSLSAFLGLEVVRQLLGGDAP